MLNVYFSSADDVLLTSGSSILDSTSIALASSTLNSTRTEAASSALDSTSIESTSREMKQQKRKRNDNTLDSFVSKSTPAQKQVFDQQIARFVYATNTAFNTVEHPEFVKLIKSLRPEYSPPARKQIAGDLLECTYRKERKKCADSLQNEIVTLGLDGWSNIHNEPIICVTLTTKNGNTFLVDTIDTSGTAHTGENLYSIATETIRKCESDFKCFVSSIVTDNARNVQKMRDLFNNENEEINKNNAITYGCAAHILNLLANDINYPNVKEQILCVIKYFRNNQYANACYRRETNSPKLIMPCEVRWNSFYDSLEGYLKSWSTLVNICESNKDKIDKNIQNLVSNISLKRNAEDYLRQLKPIAVALDKVQTANCSIGETVFFLKGLKKQMQDMKLNKDILKKLDDRYKMAITPAHMLSYLLDPKVKETEFELSPDEKKEALEYAKTRFPNNSLLPLILKYCAKSAPFEKYFFEHEFIKDVTPVEWWRSQEDAIKKFNPEVLKEIEIFLTAKASTANVERIFSSFGLVQSKLRNRLGTEKAAKLVFLFKMLNQDIGNKKD